MTKTLLEHSWNYKSRFQQIEVPCLWIGIFNSIIWGFRDGHIDGGIILPATLLLKFILKNKQEKIVKISLKKESNYIRT